MLKSLPFLNSNIFLSYSSKSLLAQTRHSSTTMDSSSMVQVPESKTTSFWTDEKHVNYLNTMEASFVRTMFQNKGCRSSSSHHSRQILRLDRQLPDSSESTLDLKPQHGSRSRKHHTPSGIRLFFISY